MGALIKALDPSDQFESSAAYLAAIIVFELATLFSPLAGNVSLYGDIDVLK